MDDVLLDGEVLLALLVFLLLVFLVWTYVRRRLIGQLGEVAPVALRSEGTQRWRVGLVRTSPDSLDWFPLVGFTTRPAHHWRRVGVQLGPVGPVDSGALTSLGLQDGLRVTIAGPGGASSPAFGEPAADAVGRIAEVDAPGVMPGGGSTAELMVGAAHYTAIRAWAEARPTREEPFGA